MELNRAIVDQLGRVAHSTLLGIANIPAIESAESLVRIAPRGLNKVFTRMRSDRCRDWLAQPSTLSSQGRAYENRSFPKRYLDR